MEDVAASGVPEIAPEVGSSAKPAGRAGLTEYPVTVPLTIGRRGPKGKPTSPTTSA